MIAYKLFKRRRDGTLGPLFINAKQRIPVGVWLEAEDHPTKGFARRPGWHCTPEPHAPHLAMRPKHGPPRVWCRVELDGVIEYARPRAQGGTWLLAKRLRVLDIMVDQ
jgi:hypothetical protein